MVHTEISEALKEGCRLHAFRSGDGLMVRVGKENAMNGYVEHPHSDSVIGSSELGGALDTWVKRGRACQAWSDNGEVVVELSGMSECMIAFTQAGRGLTFIEAFTKAVSASRVYADRSSMD